MKAERTRNFLRFYFPYREENSREVKLENIEKDCVLEELSRLESITDKWVEKETPFKPMDIGYDDGDWEGSCKCGQCVSQDQFYCHCCGQKLDWSVNK